MIKDNQKDSYIATKDGVTVYTNGRMHSVKSSNLNYDLIKSKCMRGEFSEIEELLNPLQAIEVKSGGKLKVIDNDIYYKDEVIDKELVDRLLDIVMDGQSDLDPAIKFIKNTYKNPSANSRKQLYKFIANKGMPITKEGMILGYKGVSDDYMDKHSGKFSNTVGTTNKMKRRLVDDNPDNHCSAGFHIGSKEYADSWGGCDGRLMIAEYNPKDAVSVPNEHGCQKLRVSKYTIIREVEQADRDQDLFKSTVYDTETHMDVEGSMDTNAELDHPDVWYKARNWIETNRDNGVKRIRLDALKAKFPELEAELSNGGWYDLEDECEYTKVFCHEEQAEFLYL